MIRCFCDGEMRSLLVVGGVLVFRDVGGKSQLFVFVVFVVFGRFEPALCVTFVFSMSLKTSTNFVSIFHRTMMIMIVLMAVRLLTTLLIVSGEFPVLAFVACANVYHVCHFIFVLSSHH
jgi:hypothetical protein